MNTGDHISRYRIERQLGQGGMGVVYLAEDTRLHRHVALKFLPADSFNEHDKLRFFHEAQAAALIHHPNVCPIHDIEETNGQLFISMAYLEGETLSKRIHRGKLPVDEAVDFAIQILQGLEKAHSLGIVHRDVKSRNIIVGPDGHVSILDFGLALLPGAERLTRAGSSVGTPFFMSPEQVEGRELDHRTDIWSLGVVLFEMLTGTFPFRRDAAAAVTHAIVNDATPSIAAVRPEVPAGLQRVVERALAKNAAERWDSAGAMAAALRPFGRDTRASGGAANLAELSTMTIARPLAALPSAVTATASQPHRVEQSQGLSVGLSTKSLGLALAVALVIGGGLVAGGAYLYRSTFAPPNETPAVAEAPANALERLVAVLPFEILGSGADTADLANGVTEILSAGLSDFERFEGGIAAIPSSEIRRRKINSAAEAKRVYGANLVVSGTAQPMGKKIQFAMVLIDPAKTRQLAAKIFEYDPAKPVAARKLAIDTLAMLLSLNTSVAEKAAAGGDTNAPGASLAYLKGRGLLARYDVAGNLDLAIQQLQHAVQQDPKYALAHAALGEAYWRKSRASGGVAAAAKALEHAEQAVAIDPGLPNVHVTLGAIYTTSGREQDAIKELREAQRLAPGSADATRELARVYTSLGRFGEAVSAYQQAIAARPTDWYGHLLLGLLYQQLERYDDAAQAFENAQKLTPDNELVYRNLGVVYAAQGRYDQAVSVLQRSLKIKSNAADYVTLGYVHFLQHRYAEALAAAETAIDLDPKRYIAWGNLGVYCKWNPGSESRANPAFTKAIELAKVSLAVSPKDAETRANLAEYYARTGNKEGALAEIDKIPSAERATLSGRIAIVYEFTGNRAAAIPLLVSTIKNPDTWRQIQDDPDLAALWSDPALRKAMGRTR